MDAMSPTNFAHTNPQVLRETLATGGKNLLKGLNNLLADIEKETVDFGPNYDGSESEPLLLPSRIPNLLVNGATGIAVGMATNIPPHALGEVCTALVKLLDNEELSNAQLCRYVKEIGRAHV